MSNNEIRAYLAVSNMGNVAMVSDNNDLIDSIVRVKNESLKDSNIQYCSLSLSVARSRAIMAVENQIQKDKSNDLNKGKNDTRRKK